MKMKKLISGAVIFALLLACVSPAPAFAADAAKATTMRLEQTEGTVALTGKNGKALVITDGMKLASGSQLATKAKSYAYISLDDKKAVKLDASSSAEVQKSGKKLEVLLTSGKLFFDVKAPLESDESLNVRSSTMTAGVRGTAGVIEVADGSTSKLFLFEGTVKLTDYSDPSGKPRLVTVHGGQVATSSAAPKSTDGANAPAVSVSVETMDASMVPGFAAVEIARDPVLADKIRSQSPLDVDTVIDRAQSRLASDEADQMTRQQAADMAAAAENRKIVSDHIFADKSASSSGSGSSGGGTGGDTDSSSDKPASDSITLTGTVTAEMAAEALSSYSAVTLAANETQPDKETFLTIGSSETMTIPAGKTLTLAGGTRTTVSGSLTVEGSLVDSGLLQCDSENAVTVAPTGTFQFKGGILTAASGLFSPIINDGAYLDGHGAELAAVSDCTLNNGHAYMESWNDLFAALPGGHHELAPLTGMADTNRITGDLVIPSGTSVSLNLGYYDLSLGSHSIAVQEGAALSLLGNGTLSGSGNVINISGGSAEISDNLTIHGGSAAVAGTSASANLTISGGTLQSDTGYAVKWAGTGLMNGGTVYGYRHAGASDHTFQLQSGSILEPMASADFSGGMPPILLESGGFLLKGGVQVPAPAYCLTTVDNALAPFLYSSGTIFASTDGGRYFTNPDHVQYDSAPGLAGLAADHGDHMSYALYDPQTVVHGILNKPENRSTAFHLYLSEDLALTGNISGNDLSITGVGPNPVTISGSYGGDETKDALVQISGSYFLDNIVIVNNADADFAPYTAALYTDTRTPHGSFTLKTKSYAIWRFAGASYSSCEGPDADGYYSLST